VKKLRDFFNTFRRVRFIEVGPMKTHPWISYNGLLFLHPCRKSRRSASIQTCLCS